MQGILADGFIPTYIPEKTRSVRLEFEFEDEPRKMTADEFWDFCSQNQKLNAELTKEGVVIILPPTGFTTSDKNVEIIIQLANWAKKNKNGKVTDSNGGFVLANGAVYVPDTSWTQKDRLSNFTPEQLSKFLPICPDFVLELRSESDSLPALRIKMGEYIENGARLAWLINPKDKQVEVYHADGRVEVLDNVSTVSGGEVLSGFNLDLEEIW